MTVISSPMGSDLPMARKMPMGRQRPKQTHLATHLGLVKLMQMEIVTRSAKLMQKGSH